MIDTIGNVIRSNPGGWFVVGVLIINTLGYACTVRWGGPGANEG